MISIANMSFRILLFVAAILRTTYGARYLSCELEHLHKCDLGYVAGFDDHPNDPNVALYCDVYQDWGDCSSSHAQCKREFIDSHRFVILQRMIMDKTLELCPHHNLTALKKIVQADEKYRLHVEHLSGVGKDEFAPCAANIHVKCVNQTAEDLQNKVKLCSSIHDFINCYENPDEPCSAKIYTDFIDILKKFAPQVLKMYQENPGVMPDC